MMDKVSHKFSIFHDRRANINYDVVPKQFPHSFCVSSVIRGPILDFRDLTSVRILEEGQVWLKDFVCMS